MALPNLDYANYFGSYGQNTPSTGGGISGVNFDYLTPNAGEYQFNSPVMPGSYDMSSAPAGSWWDNFNFFDKTENGVKTQGAGGLMLGGLSAGMNAYLGMKQYDLAKDTLKHNKDMFAKNFDAQRRTTNASLEDRQRSRVASNAGAYESVGSYMDKNRIV